MCPISDDISLSMSSSVSCNLNLKMNFYFIVYLNILLIGGTPQILATGVGDILLELIGVTSLELRLHPTKQMVVN